MPSDKAESTAATTASSATNGHDSGDEGAKDYGQRQGGASGTFLDGTGPDALAWWMSGAQWADELDVDPDSAIGEVLGADAWKAVRKFCRQYGVEMYYADGEGMAFSDFEALPRTVWASASPKVSVTRAQVSEFAADTMSDDPHEIGRKLKQGRYARFDREKTITAELGREKIAASTAYTLDAVAAGAGPEVADAARALINQTNRRAWSTPKPNNHREHEYLITAGELFGQLAVPGPVIATMVQATSADRDAALDELSAARIRHRDDAARRARAGDVPALDLAAEVLTVSGLASLQPVTPLIEGFLARGQLADLNGQPGTGKTMTAVSMGAAIASGRRWCGHAVPERAPVLCVAAEGAAGIRARLLAWCEVNGVEPESLEDTFIIAPRAVQMGDDKHMEQVRELVRRRNVALVVFDTRARCTVGVEENSATDHGRVISRADDINQQTGAAVLVVHHTAASGDRARGTAAWDGGVWSSLLLTRVGSKKARSRKVTLTCVKHKDWPDGCTHEFRLGSHAVGEALMPGTTAGQRSTLVLTGIDPMAAMHDDDAQNISKTHAEILALTAELGGGDGLTKADIVKFAIERGLGSRSGIYTAITALTDKGKKLVKVPGTQRLAARELIDGVPDAKDAVTAVGSPIYTEAVNAIIENLCARRAEGRITDDMAKVDAHKLVGGHGVPYAEAWARWSVNRPTDSEQVDKLKSAPPSKGRRGGATKQ